MNSATKDDTAADCFNEYSSIFRLKQGYTEIDHQRLLMYKK